MTAPWTPRERALREALKIARPMMNRIDHNVGVYEKELEAEALVDALLADPPPPPPDPRDEALKVAETSLKRINSMATRQIAKECCGDAVTLVKITTECDAALAAIAAAKGEK